MPNLVVLRPGDAEVSGEAWKVIAQLKHQPVALVLTRQAIPTFDRTKYGAASGTAKDTTSRLTHLSANRNMILGRVR